MTTWTLNQFDQELQQLAGQRRFSLAHCVGMLRLWQARHRQREQLAKMQDWQLLDIGISPEQARIEAAKPFWRR